MYRPKPPKRLRPSLAVLALCLALPPFATAAELDFDTALATAYQGNPELAAASQGPGIAAGERRQAALLPNPELSWEMEDTRSATRTTSVSLAQPLELGGKRGARVTYAERGQALAELTLEQRRNALRADTLLAFQAALRAQARSELADASLALAERGLMVAQARIRAGKAAPMEALRAQVQQDELTLERDRARTEQRQAYQRLATLMGEPRPGFERVSGRLGPLPSPPAEARLLARLGDTADLRLALADVAREEAGLDLEKARRYPDVTVSIGSQYSAEDRQRVNLVGVSLPLPLFDRNQGNVLSASRRADQARDLRNATELRLRGDVAMALEQWRRAQAAIEAHDRGILPAAQQAVDSATRGFRMGKLAFLDVLDAQRTLIDARNRYLQAMAEATEAWASLERLYGDLSGFDDPA